MSKLSENPRVCLAGSVNSSRVFLEKLIEHNINVVLVLGLNPDSAQNVSGYQDLKLVCDRESLNFSYFNKINDTTVLEIIQQENIDLLFVIGLSQLIRKELIDLPNFGVIGYHPTKLPEGRGRAAISWIVLGKAKPSVTLFKIDEGTDSGDIIFQRDIDLPEEPYAEDVLELLLYELKCGLDIFLPKLKKGEINFTPQNQDNATYLEIRRPNDGFIDWSKSSTEIQRLIRAVSHPLPGAFAMFKTSKIKIWRAEIDKELNILGVEGRVLKVDGDVFWVQTGDYPLKIIDYSFECDFEPKVGLKFSFNFFDLYNLISNE